MRFIQAVALLPALAVAQEQVPLGDRVQGWFNKAKSYLPTATPVVPAVPVVEKVVEKAAKIEIKTVTPVNLTNWQTILEPASEPQDWLVYVTGGNKTCFGRCAQADQAFNESVLLFSADSTSPNLAKLECETNQVLCSAWAAGAPSVFYFQVPQAQLGEERPATTLHAVQLNSTTVTPETIYKVHSEKVYENEPAYEGPLHPTDGWLAQNGLLLPLGYVIYGFSSIPSWLFMIGISFFSRTFIIPALNPSINRRPSQNHQTQTPNPTTTKTPPPPKMADIDRSAPSTTAYVVATAILAGITGYFIGQGSSLGLFSTKEKEGWPNSYNVKVHRDSSDEDYESSEEEDDEDSEDEGDGSELASFDQSAEEVKLVLVVRTDLGMTKGKIAAQCSHATLACYKYLAAHTTGSSILRRWESQGQAKIALQVKSEEDMEELQAKAISLGLCARVITDAGRTQIASGSRTVLGVLGPKSVVDGVTGHLKLL
ncbi:PTH2-domain-containing protein [Aspergillus heteromorphus CBS 117.55]|uniref:peptidyl-tRNA hydrolase n=1 Tax=Aspergillus heteromorphus CBS 117.55 TaxID=1448321 RepID=A0A317WN17_9EURO|nr:PTH2-domain-containing protein [Aspergillus heteromorphus CBS 117.55]PWY87683.1 PTH2-domain-containing protein [Aspergillus heteromorphus CBS 117.55]